jgi:hypothetical protein
MKALILYVTFVLVGVALSVGVGWVVEVKTSSALGLVVFLSMFFANFAIAWILTILAMDGSLKNAQGALDQANAEKIGEAAMKKAKSDLSAARSA